MDNVEQNVELDPVAVEAALQQIDADTIDLPTPFDHDEGVFVQTEEDVGGTEVEAAGFTAQQAVTVH